MNYNRTKYDIDKLLQTWQSEEKRKILEDALILFTMLEKQEEKELRDMPDYDYSYGHDGDF